MTFSTERVTGFDFLTKYTECEAITKILIFKEDYVFEMRSQLTR